MASHPSLTRRTMLQASGIGVLALTIPLPEASAAAAGDAPPQFRRSSYLGHEGQAFVVQGSPSLTLEEVTDLSRAASDASLKGHEEAFVLRLTSASGDELESAVHGLLHPELGSIALFLSPVEHASSGHTYEVVVDRTVRLASALDAPSTPEAIAASTAAVEAAAAAGESPAGAGAAPRGTAVAASIAATRRAAARLRVRATARRAGKTVTTELTFPGGGVQAARVRLVRKGHTYASGGGAVKRGHAVLHLRASRHLSRGVYELVVTATDHHGAATTVSRTVSVR